MARRQSSSGNGSPFDEKLRERDPLDTSADCEPWAGNLPLLDISSTEIESSSETIGPLLRSMSSKEVYYTENIKEDIEVFKECGLIIDYPNGKIGEGLYGNVFNGIYGHNATQLLDVKCQPMSNIEPGMPFAAKVVDFNKPKTGKSYIDPRDSYEVERHILTFADHPNITPLRLALNMGRPQVYTNKTTELGSLDIFLGEYTDLLTITDRIKMIKDLFWGLKYLHDNNITHGDVHEGNALVFRDSTGYITKWADFGGGCFTQNLNDNKLIEKMQDDCLGFSYMLDQICPRPLDDQPQDIRQSCDAFNAMIQDIEGLLDLNQVLIVHRLILGQNRPINPNVK